MRALLAWAAAAVRFGPPPPEAIQLSTQPLLYRVPAVLDAADREVLLRLAERRIKPRKSQTTPRERMMLKVALYNDLGTAERRRAFWDHADRTGNRDGELDIGEMAAVLKSAGIPMNAKMRGDEMPPRRLGAREAFAAQDDWAEQLYQPFLAPPEVGWATKEDLDDPALAAVLDKFRASAGVEYLADLQGRAHVQLLRYLPESWFACHYDSNEDEEVGHQVARALTIYTSFGNYTGGETGFPNGGTPALSECELPSQCRAGILLDTQAPGWSPGDIAFWWTRTMDGDRWVAKDEASLHAGCPVTSGVKYGVTVWVGAARRDVEPLSAPRGAGRRRRAEGRQH